MATLKLEDFSDRELLWALEDHADGDGTVSSVALAEGLGLKQGPNDFKRPAQNVAIRLSWLKRYGVVYRDADTMRWGLTTVGQSLLHGKLTAAEARALRDMNPEKLLVVMQEIGGVMKTAKAEAAKMAERDWRYTLAQRKRA